MVTPGYFAAMGIPVVTGRDVNASDVRGGAPVVLINHTLAQREWAGQDPIGRRMRAGADGAWMTVIGVVGDIRHMGPAVPPRAEFYQPYTQRSFSFMAFVVRTGRRCRSSCASDPIGSRAVGSGAADLQY